jgi:hypothetical protein
MQTGRPGKKPVQPHSLKTVISDNLPNFLPLLMADILCRSRYGKWGYLNTIIP